MNIALIGSGNMGSILGQHWAKAGHDVVFSSRHPEKLAELVKRTPRARAATPEDAARGCEVVFLGVPYAAMPDLARTLAPLLVGKLVLDAGNLIPMRDGALAAAVTAAGRGSGVYTASLLPGAHVVKAFNTVYFKTIEAAPQQRSAKVGVPLAGEDPAQLETAAQLVRDAGMEPVILPGGLAAAVNLDHGKPVWNSNLPAAELRVALGLRP
jgi:predicted dinucleotide-binding enzyme